MILSAREGETEDEFIARVIATPGRKLTDEELDVIWAMLPPVRVPRPDDREVA